MISMISNSKNNSPLFPTDLYSHQSDALLFQVHSSPQNNRVHKQISQLMNHHTQKPQQPTKPDNHRSPRPAEVEEMAPQSISFIADDDQEDEPPAPVKSYASQFTTFRKSPSSASSNLSNKTNTNSNHDLEISLGRLNITSGNRTYRIASPTKQHPHATVLNSNSFQGIEVS
jgi:calmodulin-regulated spectrin-associated protein